MIVWDSNGSPGRGRRVMRFLRKCARSCGLVAGCCLALASAGFADDPAPIGATPDATGSFVSLTVEPVEIVLHTASRQQQVLITAKQADGKLVDVTRRMEFSIADNAIARLDGTAIVGLHDGVTEMTASTGSLSVKTRVRVQGFDQYPPVHFALDVVPVLSKLGCNSGGCHGRASGQNGFKLSVFGFDPVADYDSIVKQARGRRVFPSSPARSLILAKPSGGVPHGGGVRLIKDSLDYQLLSQWIDQGMPVGEEKAARLVGLQVIPQERELAAGGQQQILATAVYSDGSLRDVSSAALYSGNAPHVAEVDAHGLIRCGQAPGEAAITVNYMGQIAAVQIQSPRAGGPVPYPELPVQNEVDRFVWTKLRKMGLVPSELADDATFLRRTTLDCLGTLPTPDEVRTFLADSSSDKRAKWIDRLLTRDEYADYWALKWADILLVDREKLGDRGAFELHRWLRGQFAVNRPYDEWVRELITAAGDSAKSGPVNFYRAADTPDAVARTVSQAFLGVRIECAQCHHHPFEKWSQEDYYSLAGFFNGIERKPLTKDRVLVFHAGYRDMPIPDSTLKVAARGLDAPVSPQLSSTDPRVVLAAWMTALDNPWFARLVVNRLWKHYLGRGLVEAEDDLRSTNPPTNPPLLDFLARRLVESKFDLKAVMRLIMNSRTYQLCSEPNANNRDDEQNFSSYTVKRLPAEPLLDAISAVTEVPEPFPGRPPGTRAIALWDNRLPSYFLEIFGRPERTSPCECARSSDPTMAQALHLMNAPEVEAKVSDPAGRVARLVAAGVNEDKIVEELCLAAIGRFPTARHKSTARKLFASSTPREAAEDFLWTLLNSYDFLFVK
ncbi:MAG: DUF1549 domain-containing protein [Planctomycetaceae bacterium]|nr:DUF1549 domain-containing protein [Planctomycetaceae bacterium]